MILIELCVFPGLWAIVNNAGIPGPFVPAEWATKQDFTSVYNVNAVGMTQVNNIFLDLVKIERGRIINMSSVMGRFAGAAVSPYAMSKYAVEAYSDSLR